MNNFNFIKNGPDVAQLTISYAPSSNQKIAHGVPTVKTLTYSELIHEFFIKIGNKHTTWNFPAMITDTWQWVSFQINLENLSRIFPEHLKGQIQNIELLFYMKSLENSQIDSFNSIQTQSKEVFTDKKRKILNYKSKFKILNGNTSIQLGKIFYIGLRIDDFVVKYLVTDILIGSHQNQIKPPFKIKEKNKEQLREQTFWFQEAEKTVNLEASKKRARSDVEDASEKIPLKEGESEIKKGTIIRDDLLFDLFPEAYLDIEGVPYFPIDIPDL